jgi:hypothetical protein
MLFSCDEDSSLFFLFVSCYFVSGVCFIFLCFVFLNWVCWVCGIFSGEPGHVYISWCVSAVWSAGPVQVNLGILLERVAALYRFSFSFGAVVAGTVRLK